MLDGGDVKITEEWIVEDAKMRDFWIAGASQEVRKSGVFSDSDSGFLERDVTIGDSGIAGGDAWDP